MEKIIPELQGARVLLPCTVVTMFGDPTWPVERQAVMVALGDGQSVHTNVRNVQMEDAAVAAAAPEEGSVLLTAEQAEEARKQDAALREANAKLLQELAAAQKAASEWQKKAEAAEKLLQRGEHGGQKPKETKEEAPQQPKPE